MSWECPLKGCSARRGKEHPCANGQSGSIRCPCGEMALEGYLIIWDEVRLS